jgi:hypothetical protein
MVPRVRFPLTTARLGAIAAVLALLAGCGSGARATAGVPDGSCPETVVRTLGSILERIYHEGVKSERTGAAGHIVAFSAPLRRAIESGNPAAVRTAARALLATGHLTNLRILAGKRTLADLGGPALTPLHGVIKDAAGSPIATYLTSVWSDNGFTAEARGVTAGLVAIRAGSRSLGGTPALPGGGLAGEGTLSLHGISYQYFSFPGEAYPAGPVRIYLLRPNSSFAPLCASSSEDTLVNTLSHIAALIYAGEIGSRTHAQLRRIEHDSGLLRAVARQDPAATRAAIITLLNQHVVRLRVVSSGRLLGDVGGPFVLGPIGGTLRLGGRRIGTFLFSIHTFLFSIQDDEGYLRLARRLAGLKVLMYMSPARPGGPPQLVKNSLGPSPGTVPASGRYSYRGASFRVYTVHATAFPSGPLTIRVLIPIPYS